MKTTAYIISCPIFDKALQTILPAASTIETHLLDYRVHNDAACMESELDKAISKSDPLHHDIKMLVGSECYCLTSIKEIASKSNAVYPKQKNCLEILLGFYLMINIT